MEILLDTSQTSEYLILDQSNNLENIADDNVTNVYFPGSIQRDVYLIGAIT